jgi:DHA2 family multidrug resistance protein
MAQAIYTIGVIMGPTLGPTLGGYIVDNYSWPYIFYINIPVGIVATILTLSYIRSPKYEEKRPASQVDWLGIALLTIGISSLQYVLEKGQEEDWYNSKIIIFFTGTATLGMLTFIWRELSYAYPIVNLRVLKNSNLRIGVMLSFVLGFGLYGASFILPLFTQSLLGWTAMQAGMLQLPTTIFVMFMLPLVGKLIQSGVPQKYLIAIGLMIFFIYSMYASSLLTLETSSGNLFWILMVRGLGLSLLSVPVSTMALSTLKGQEIGQGAAFSGMMRQLGGSFGVALISTFVYRQTQVHRNVLITHLPAYDPDVQQRLAQLAAKVQHESGLDSLTSRQTAYAMLDRSVNTQATLLSYTDVFLWIGLMFLIFVPIVLVFVAKGKNKISLADAAH